MSTALTVECKVEFRRLAKGRKQLQEAPATPRPVVPPGRVPRVSRLMALALRFEALVRAGEVASYAELARLGHVTRSRVSQIMNLLYLSPDIQEAILFLPRTQRGRDPISLRDMQPVGLTLDWREQRRIWGELLSASPRQP
jgi:hypothetical protein